ncbi:FAD-dependent monooxygenase [Streptosporangium sp. NPDC049248]|uniref:FAD-dependent monooxygenase n=1 Tax=Streptosporangium sp. NPDC049248 TaxID=3155651 RepID=UPI00343E0DCD
MDVPVLIVGGGPVGLCASIALSGFGVPSLLVERHAATSAFPKGRALSIRTMEVLRRYGLEEAVLAAGVPREESLHFFFGTSLTCADHIRNSNLPDPARAAFSPAFTAVCSQDVLEPLLREHAESLGPGWVHFGQELIALEQDERGVTAWLRDADGQTSTLRTAYVIAADGAGSFVRRELGIAMSGDLALSRNLNILFEADLRPHLADRLSLIYTIANPALTGTFMTVDNRRRWLFNLVHDPARRAVDDLTPRDCADLIHEAAAVPDLDIDVIATQEWTAAALLADRYRAGRVFLAGDAAHPMTPYGGFGMNCGIQDADNLAWKLAAVLQGWAGPELLDSYEAERRPVGADTVTQSRRSLLATLESTAVLSGVDGPRPCSRPSDGLVLGYAYDGPGAAVVPDGTSPPDLPDPVCAYRPSARPGHRLPHLWTRPEGREISTLDLVGTGFTLLTGPGGAPWRESVPQGVPLLVHVGDADIATACGIEADGAVLVRPDDHVAWRCPWLPDRPEQAVAQALATVLSR